MTDVPMHMQLVAGERSEVTHNQIMSQPDDSSMAKFSLDVKRVAPASKRLHMLRRVQKIIDSQYSAGDYQIGIMYGQDDQPSTRDARVDTTRQEYQTVDVPSTAFMAALVSLRWRMAFERQDIEAITHMDYKEVIDKLSARGFVDVAERLIYLYDVTEEDEEDIKLDSLRGFATLLIKNHDMHLPQITITDDGLIQAVWRHPRQGTLVMDFQESGDVEFTLLYGRWDQETKRHKLSGELHLDEVMLHVGRFVRGVMWT